MVLESHQYQQKYFNERRAQIIVKTPEVHSFSYFVPLWYYKKSVP